MNRSVGFSFAAILLSMTALVLVLTGYPLAGLPFALAACGCSVYSFVLSAREYRG